ncbi:MAG: hypothetical protein HC915_21455, partial [Anaerolineae bacterium]|nr:hypothetical protein [Anaerolineae bacterium]
SRRWILELGSQQIIHADGWLAGGATTGVAFEALMARMGNLREATRTMVEGLGAVFIDLTPAFQEAALRGERLFYKYDTHWNQAGHDLAGQVVAEALRNGPRCAAG